MGRNIDVTIFKPNIGLLATTKQCDYAETLLNDCGMWEQRRSVLELRFNKSHLSDLTKTEISSLIDELKKVKESRAEVRRSFSGTHKDL